MLHIYSYKATNTTLFHARETTSFVWGEHRINAENFLKHQSAFPSARLDHKGFIIPFDMTKSGGYPNLIVTDNPHEVFTWVATDWLRRSFSLENLIATAVSLGIKFESWHDSLSLPTGDWGRILSPHFHKLASDKKITLEAMLGGKIISWEEAGAQYYFVETRGDKILLLPRQQSKSFVFSDSYDKPTAFLLIGEHRQPGEELAWIESSERDMVADLNHTNPIQLFTLDNTAGIEEQISRVGASNYGILQGDPVIDFKRAISPLRSSFKPVVYITPNSGNRGGNSGEFLLEELVNLARRLGVKGYSSKTKAEVVMLIGEHLATLPPIETRSLLIEEVSSYNPLYNIVDQSQLTQVTQYMSEEDQFLFAMRVIGRAAYVPSAGASPAGRLNTSGEFKAALGYEPLDLLTPEF